MTVPYHTIPYHTISYHTRPDHIRSYLTTPYHTMPYHIRTHHIRTYHIRPYHTKSEHTRQDHTIPYHTITFHTIPKPNPAHLQAIWNFPIMARPTVHQAEAPAGTKMQERQERPPISIVSNRIHRRPHLSITHHPRK